MNAAATPPRIALIGFGEVGQALAADLYASGIHDLAAWDRLFTSTSSAPSRAAAMSGHARAAAGIADALADRTLVISAVTAGECLAAALESAASIRPGTVYFDLNSVAPATRSAAADAIAGVGGRYVEAAVMSPIAAKRIATPMLIGGPYAAAFAPRAQALGFTGVQVFDADIGRASAAKMCRSVIIKGLEALFTESLLAARRHRVEDTVIASLRDLFPHEDWEQIAAYMIARALRHGRRRAEEMQEAAKTVAEAGIDPWMSTACAKRQYWMAARGEVRAWAPLARLLDAVLDAGHAEKPEDA